MKQVVWLYGYNLNIGGVETQMLSLLSNRYNAGYHWLIVSQISPHFAARAAQCGAELARWRLRNAFDVLAFARLFFLLRQHRPTVLHIHSPNAALIGTGLSRLLGIPCVLTIHLPLYDFVIGDGIAASLKRRLYAFAERLSQRLAAKVIYVSAQVYQEALRLRVAPQTALVIQNGVEIDHTGPRHAVPDLRQVVICCVGRLEYQKGIDVLIKAIACLHKADYPFQVHIVGDGSQRVALESVARSLGVQTRVKFTGFREDVASILSASDIFALPSRHETTPIALLEAMSAGLPCVVTDVGENAQLVANGLEGFVVPPNDAKKLAAALMNLIADPDLRRRMGQAARLKVEQYSAARMAEKTFNVYQSLLK